MSAPPPAPCRESETRRAAALSLRSVRPGSPPTSHLCRGARRAPCPSAAAPRAPAAPPDRPPPHIGTATHISRPSQISQSPHAYLVSIRSQHIYLRRSISVSRRPRHVLASRHTSLQRPHAPCKRHTRSEGDGSSSLSSSPSSSLSSSPSSSPPHCFLTWPRSLTRSRRPSSSAVGPPQGR